MKKKLAIIIPAYKTRFLRETLDSIMAQSCPDFTVYVGDDASPEDIKGVVQDYCGKLNIVYHRFETNLGRTDLPGHWDRCIGLSQEPLVWLFSDDDVMPSDAVERLLRTVERCGDKRVCMRFPLMVIDAGGKMKFQNPPFEQERISGYDLLIDKLSAKISSAACEYVFSRDVWQQSGGFVKFPLAWCSDDASWATFADVADGIVALPGKPVGWRNAEGENISNSTCYDGEKIKATTLFVGWISSHYASRLGDKRLHRALKTYIHTILTYSVRGNFSLHDLAVVCLALCKISRRTAFRVACRHVLKIKKVTRR